MSNIYATIADIEAKMAANQARIDETSAQIAPLLAEREAINVQIQALQAQAGDIQGKIDALRGADWLEFKKSHGVLASTRMQLRAAAKALG